MTDAVNGGAAMDADSPEQQFARRLAAIHGSGSHPALQLAGAGREDDVVHDVRRAEMLAMIDAFLGERCDALTRERLLASQALLHQRQAQLLQSWEASAISARDYVESFNRELRRDLEACESLLGTQDFRLLFGCDIDEAQGYIDLETFMAAHARRPEAAVAGQRTRSGRRSRPQ